MTAANGSESRRAMAKRIGLSRKPATKATTDEAAPDGTAKEKRARRSGTEALKTSRERFESDKG